MSVLSVKSKMNKLTYNNVVLMLIGLFLSACAQLTTNGQEEAALKTTADTDGATYVSCLTTNGQNLMGTGTIDIATAIKMAGDRCQPALNSYKTSQEKYLKSNMMLTDKPLEKSVAALNELAGLTLGEQLVSMADDAVTPANFSSVTGWSSQQQEYLDCMTTQGLKYATLNEAAAVIAEVAQNRCKGVIGNGQDTAALVAEGRTQVMGIVLDAKLNQSAD